MWRRSTIAIIALAFGLFSMKGVLAQQPPEENLAKAAQNPVAATISVHAESRLEFDQPYNHVANRPAETD